MNDIINFLKLNSLITYNEKSQAITLSLEKKEISKELKYESISTNPKIYFENNPSIEYKQKQKDIVLSNYDCYMFDQNKKVFICFKSKKIFYIYTTGLLDTPLLLQNFFNLFLPKFLEFFKDIIINILNFDNFNINNTDLYAFNESYINKNTELNLILKKNNLKLFNFFYNEYFNDKHLKIINNERTDNYIILDFAHLIQYNYIKKTNKYRLTNKFYDAFKVFHGFVYFNNIYLGYDNLMELNKDIYLNEILKYLFISKKEKDNIPFQLTPLYYYLIRLEIWKKINDMFNTPHLPKEFFEKLYEMKNSQEKKITVDKQKLKEKIFDNLKDQNINYEQNDDTKLLQLYYAHLNRTMKWPDIEIQKKFFENFKSFIIKDKKYDDDIVLNLLKDAINEKLIIVLEKQHEIIFRLLPEKYILTDEDKLKNEIKKKYKDSKDIIISLFKSETKLFIIE